jgi:DNA-binding MarR family transcriptional regulator
MRLSDHQCLRLVHSLFNITRAYEKEIERKVFHLQPSLSIQDLGMLVILGLYAPMTSRQLSEKMEISPAMTSLCVQKYVENGLLYREQDKNDRRNWWLYLTDEGQELFQTSSVQPLI